MVACSPSRLEGVVMVVSRAYSGGAMSKSIRAKIIGPFLLIVGIFGLYSGFEQNGVAARIQKEGVSVPAQVMDQRIRSGRRGSRTYLVTVDYQPKGDGGSIQKEFSVSK